MGKILLNVASAFVIVHYLIYVFLILYKFLLYIRGDKISLVNLIARYIEAGIPFIIFCILMYVVDCNVYLDGILLLLLIIFGIKTIRNLYLINRVGDEKE